MREDDARCAQPQRLAKQRPHPQLQCAEAAHAKGRIAQKGALRIHEDRMAAFVQGGRRQHHIAQIVDHRRGALLVR